MGLDARVYCNCAREGKARPHPFPEHLVFDETGEPTLAGDSPEEEWDTHDRWLQDACEHSGHLAAERLGNISLIASLREFLQHLQGDPGPHFPILLGQVVYDGTHSGDWIPSSEVPTLLAEIDTVLHSRDILAKSESGFFSSLRRLCLASIKTGNPIVF